MTAWNRPSRLSLVVLTFLVFPAGTLAYRITVAPARWAAQAQAWPEVACEITESRVNTSRAGGGPIRSEPIVRYRYEVAGKAYTGSTIEYVGSYSGFDIHQQVIRPYPKGLVTTCRVNPNDPSDSVLNPHGDIEGTLVLAAIFGGGFLVLLCAAVFWWWRYFKLRPVA